MKYVLNIFGLLIILFSFCTRRQDPIVARFGSHEISLDEFRLAYLEVIKRPTAFDSRELREAFLDEMVNRRLLAEQARQLNLDEDELFQLKSEAFHNKCLREAHYRHVIEPKVQIDEALLKETFQYTKEQRHIKHLFFKDKTSAESAYALLQNGVSFDEMAKHVFPNTALAKSGGDLGWIYWDQMEYDMAMQAFRMKPGEISKPVRSSHGYHILQVVDWKRNLFLSEEDFGKQREKISYLLKAKIGEKLAFQHIEKMMKNLDIKVRPKELEIVGKHLERLFSGLSNDSTKISESQIFPEEIDSVGTTVWNIRHRPLFIIDGKPVTVGQFICNLPYLPSSIIRKSYKTALDYSIRDFQLTRAAKKLNLGQTSKEVKIKSKLFDEYLLQIMLRKQTIDNIKVTEDEVIHKYQELSGNTREKEIPESHKAVIARMILRDKKATEVPKLIEKLRKGLDIQKHVEPIHSYYDNLSK